MRESIQLAMSYIEQGYSAVAITDLETGDTMDQRKIIAVAAQVKRLNSTSSLEIT